MKYVKSSYTTLQFMITFSEIDLWSLEHIIEHVQMYVANCNIEVGRLGDTIYLPVTVEKFYYCKCMSFMFSHIVMIITVEVYVCNRLIRFTVKAPLLRPLRHELEAL